MPNIDGVVNGPPSQVRFQAVMTGRDTSGNILPEARGAYNFEVRLSGEDNTGKSTSAKGERGGKAIASPQ
ncbi:MAG TPA: hypothetical protein VL122_04340 [Nitrospirota bacterium]|nr:hypothetical protein [Nitrospirota bacterium]